MGKGVEVKRYVLEINLKDYFNDECDEKYPVYVEAESLEKAKDDFSYMSLNLSFSCDSSPWLNDTGFCNLKDVEDLNKVREDK
jgi:hypothetical protein